MNENRSKCECIFCSRNAEKKKEREEIISRIVASEKEKGKIKNGEMKDVHPFVLIPKEPASFGHVIVVSGKPFSDIGDQKFSEGKHKNEIIDLITALASTMKKHLKNGRKACRKVYLVSECENPILHLHFHLIPNFDGDNQGHFFLYEKELEEARWMVNGKKDEEKQKTETEKVRDGCRRIGQIAGMLGYHTKLLSKKVWIKEDLEREKLIEQTKEFFNQYKEEWLKDT